MSMPLAIDLFCGLGGWTQGLLAENFTVIGFDIERHDYGIGVYPAQLVLQDVLTLHGKQFKDAALIVASPPCQEYSYMAMPWSRAKAIAAEYRSGVRDVKTLTALFDACFRIQREACEAAGHFIPLVVENVRGAQPWVGRSRWAYGSFFLWGDVPALMPMTKAVMKFNPDGTAHPPGSWFKIGNSKTDHSWDDSHKTHGMNWFDRSIHGQDFTCIAGAQKTAGHVNQRDGHDHTRHLTNQAESDGVKNQGTTCFSSQETRAQPVFDGVKQHKSGRAWFADADTISGSTSSKSKARKAASAAIARIPLPLARHIARTYYPRPY